MRAHPQADAISLALAGDRSLEALEEEFGVASLPGKGCGSSASITPYTRYGRPPRDR